MALYTERMTNNEDTQSAAQAFEGEVLISGLDTGPREDERQNRSPTVKLMGLQPEVAGEPDDEDG